MGSSQEPTFSSASTAAQVNACALDLLPVYAKELIAGGAAGAFAKTAVKPLERVKILLQTITEGFQSFGILRSLRKLWQYEGIRAFYKGNGAGVLRMVPYAALHYMTYEQYRCWILNNFAPSVGTGPVVDLLAGSAAGGTAVLCTYPLDLARTKLTYQVSNVAQPGNALGNSGRHLRLHGGVAAQEPGAGRGAPRRPHPTRGVRQDPARVLGRPRQPPPGPAPTGEVSGSLYGALIGSVLAFTIADFFRTTQRAYSCFYLIFDWSSSHSGGTQLPYDGGWPIFIWHRNWIETAPSQKRGMFISPKEFFIVLGMLLGYIAGNLYVQVVSGWRYMYATSTPLCLIMGVGMCWLPASPRWLLLCAIQGKGNLLEIKENATRCLCQLRGQASPDLVSEQVNLFLDELSYVDQEKETCFSEIFRGKCLKAMIIGCGLVFFQQVTGQPSVLYYATTILQVLMLCNMKLFSSSMSCCGGIVSSP